LQLPAIFSEFETDLDMDESAQASQGYGVAKVRIIGSRQIVGQLGQFDDISSKWPGSMYHGYPEDAPTYDAKYGDKISQSVRRAQPRLLCLATRLKNLVMNAACHRAVLKERFATWHVWTISGAVERII
jgi:hypothetical protein